MPLVTRPFLLSLLVVLQLFPDVLATTQPRGEGHRDSLPPEYWTIKEVASPHHTSRLRQLARADPSLHHSVTFAVLQKNLDTLTQLLHNVSDPRHPQYGRHWTRAQIGALTANPEASAKTLAYLLNSTRLQGRVEIVRRSLFDEYIVARAPVTVWEEALNTQFFEFDQLSTSPASRKHRNVAALEYSLPTYLADHILGVFDVLPFKKESSALRLLHPMDPNVFMDRVAATAEVGGLVQPEEKSNNYDGAVTPSVINSVYSVFSNKGNGLASQAVAFPMTLATISPNPTRATAAPTTVLKQALMYNISWQSRRTYQQLSTTVKALSPYRRGSVRWPLCLTHPTCLA